MNPISNTYRVVCLSLAFLVFFTSIGLTINMHFCGHHLKSISLFGKAKNCFELAEMATTKGCPKHQNKQSSSEGCEMEKKGCCQDRTLSLQADLTSDIQSNNFILSSQLQDFVVAFTVAFLENKLGEATPYIYTHYKPPLICRDIPVLIQSFLI